MISIKVSADHARNFSKAAFSLANLTVGGKHQKYSEATNMRGHSRRMLKTAKRVFEQEEKFEEAKKRETGSIQILDISIPSLLRGDADVASAKRLTAKDARKGMNRED